MKSAMAVLFVLTLTGCAQIPAVLPGDAPAADQRTLYFLHGALVERQGVYARHPRYGAYHYQALVSAFEAEGFDVIGEVRPLGTPPDSYAQTLAARIRAQIEGGADPSRIALVGFAKGGMIALLTAANLQRPELSTVLLAGCGDGRYEEDFERVKRRTEGLLQGRYLSMLDHKDPGAQSCLALAALSPDARFEEQVYTTGAGPGLFYRPRLDWLVRVSRWIRQAWGVEGAAG